MATTMAQENEDLLRLCRGRYHPNLGDMAGALAWPRLKEGPAAAPAAVAGSQVVRE
jgi:hypothetical protein